MGMRARNVKPGFFRNELLGSFPFETRLLFIGLWTLADREGRMEDRPLRMRVEIFPYDEGVNVDNCLEQLKEGGFILRYEVNGTKYIQVENFVKHQDPHYREKASEIPPPPNRENKIIATGVTRTQRQRIMERDGCKCKLCGSENYLTIDHIIPISRGGQSNDDNLQVLCMACNTSKGNKLDFELNSGRTSNELESNNKQDVPLNPDSLNPDSLNPESSATMKEQEKKANADEEPGDPPGMDELRREWTKTTGKIMAYPSFGDQKAMIEALSILPANEVLSVMQQVKKRFKPKYQGDKISTFSYFIGPMKQYKAIKEQELKARSGTQKEVTEKEKAEIKAINDIINQQFAELLECGAK